MISEIAGFFGSLFSSSKLTDTAVDGIRKLGGLDEMNSKDKAQFLLDNINATKHQSPSRRFIAITMLIGLMLFTGTWLLLRIIAAAVAYYGGDNGEIMRACDDIFAMAETVLMQPMNIIIGFYFVTDIAKRFGK
jgi:hypothetical protein